MSCAHEDFAANVHVARIVTEEGGTEAFAFAAEVTICCAACGASLGFRALDVGLLPDRPTVSPDALTLRVPLLSPAELELAGPLAGLDPPPPPSPQAGFRVRRSG